MRIRNLNKHAEASSWSAPIRSVLASTLLLSLLCVSRILFYRGSSLSINIQFELWIAIPVIQLIVWVVLLWERNSVWNRLLVTLPALIVFAAVAILCFGDFDSLAIWIAEFFVCVTFYLGWLGVGLGFVWIAFQIANRSRRHATVGRSTILRVWLVTTLFLVTTEIAAIMVSTGQVQKQPVPSLPESLPEHADDEFHIAAIGASTMVGFPYQPKVGIPQLLAEMLRTQSPQPSVKVSNLAEVGINLRMAIERLKGLERRPDVLLVYSGHNEAFYDVPLQRLQLRLPRRLVDPWLNWSRSYSLLTSLFPQTTVPKQMGPLAGSIIGEPIFHSDVMRDRVMRFRSDLESLADFCNHFKIPILMFLPARSEGVFAPNRSSCEVNLSQADEIELNEQYSTCLELIDQKMYAAANSKLNQISTRAPGIAEIEFQIGVCLAALGETTQARQQFDRAAELDQQPPHITDVYRKTIRSVAAQHDIELIDATPVLREASPSGLLDTHVMLDYVHPTLQGFYSLAVSAYQSNTMNAVFPTLVTESVPLTFDESIQRTGFSAMDLAIAYERTAACIEFMGRYQIDASRKMKVAKQFRVWADELRNEKLQPGEDGTEDLTGQPRPGVNLTRSPVFQD